MRKDVQMERFDISDLLCGDSIHFIGIGGISMSGLASICLELGFYVTGSDWNESKITKKLEASGARIVYGHDAVNYDGIERASLVVYTAAAKDDNPEIIAAKKRNVTIIDRAEFLGAIMRCFKHAINVSGTHGKTTTTSMLAHALVHAELDPTVSLGGELDLIDGNIRIGKSQYFLTEACEYTNSFLKFFPTLALITNVEEDHLDFFKDIEDIRNSFRKFAMLTKGVGKVIAYGEDENIKKVLDGTDLDIITYGLNNTCDYYSKNLIYNAGYPQFDIYNGDTFIMHLNLNVPGAHNVQNALATAVVCEVLGVDRTLAAEGIESFRGTHRRFEKKGFINNAIVIDDYAHHPTEIKATLKAAREFPHSKIYCIFQPHTYSRTRTLWDEFLEAFCDTDELILTHIYPAREVFDGVTRVEDLCDEIKKRGVDAKYIDDFNDVVKYIKENASDNDIVFTMGAGDVTKISDMLTK